MSCGIGRLRHGGPWWPSQASSVLAGTSRGQPDDRRVDDLIAAIRLQSQGAAFRFLLLAATRLATDGPPGGGRPVCFPDGRKLRRIVSRRSTWSSSSSRIDILGIVIGAHQISTGSPLFLDDLLERLSLLVGQLVARQGLAEEGINGPLERGDARSRGSAGAGKPIALRLANLVVEPQRQRRRGCGPGQRSRRGIRVHA